MNQVMTRNDLEKNFTKNLGFLTVLMTLTNLAQIISACTAWGHSYYGDWVGFGNIPEATILVVVVAIALIISLTFSLLQLSGAARFKQYVILVPFGVISIITSISALTRVYNPRPGLIVSLLSSVLFLIITLVFIQKYRSVDLHRPQPQQVIVQQSQTPRPAAPPVSMPEELQKFHELLKSGAISESEYEAQKRRLLG